MTDGGAVRRSDGILAGSSTLLEGCLRHARAWLPWLSIADVVRMATQTPADALGLPARGAWQWAPTPISSYSTTSSGSTHAGGGRDRVVTEPDTALLNAEIDEQPDVIARVLQQQRATVERLATAIQALERRTIVLVARGSSDNAAVYGRYLLEVCNRRLVSLAAPSSVTLYGSAPDLAETLVIGVSQSGQGEDVVAYLREARDQGATTVAIVNDEGSPLTSAAEWVLPCMAGPEVSVPATKTVTAQMTLLAMLSAALGSESAAVFGALDRLPDAVGRALRAPRRRQRGSPACWRATPSAPSSDAALRFRRRWKSRSS